MHIIYNIGEKYVVCNRTKIFGKFIFLLQVFFSTSEVKRLVKQTFHENKSGGYKKLHKQGKDGFAGLTQRKISKVIMEDPKLRKHSITFTNKARPRPVRVKNVYDQHQIDMSICVTWQ